MDEENDNRESKKKKQKKKQMPATQRYSVNKGIFQQFEIRHG
jgi:hypothetical protein